MKYNKVIGIAGGMGPYADLDLIRKILDQTIAYKDQDHFSIALLSNPREIIDGNFSFILPVGKYYLEIIAPGYMRTKTHIFEVQKALPLVSDYQLKKSPKINLGPISFFLPTFLADLINANIGLPKIGMAEEISLKESEFPIVSLYLGKEKEESLNLRGRPSLVVVTSSWLPSVSEQIKIIGELAKENQNLNYLIVLSQETGSKAEVFVKRGKYEVPILADPDGEIVTELKLQSLPINIFINSKGIIKETKGGVLNKEEIQSYIKSSKVFNKIFVINVLGNKKVIEI